MEISDKFEIEDYEMVPGLYGDLLWMVRGTTLSVLVSVKDTVFHCEKDCTTKQVCLIFEPPREKTNNLHIMRKQRRRSASR